MSQQTKLISIKNLSILNKFNKSNNDLLNDVSLDIYSGDVISIIGEVGSGKSVLGKSILGLYDQELGSIKVKDRLVPYLRMNHPGKKHRWLYETGQLIFQDPSLSIDYQRKIKLLLSEGPINFDIVQKQLNSKIESYEFQKQKAQEILRQATDFEYAFKIKFKNLSTNLLQELKDSLKLKDPQFSDGIFSNEVYAENQLKIQQVASEHEDLNLQYKRKQSYLNKKYRSQSNHLYKRFVEFKKLVKQTQDHQPNEIKQLKEFHAKEDIDFKKSNRLQVKDKIYAIVKTLKIDGIELTLDSKFDVLETVLDLQKQIRRTIKGMNDKQSFIFYLANAFLIKINLIEKQVKDPFSFWNTKSFDYLVSDFIDNLVLRLDFDFQTRNDIHDRLKELKELKSTWVKQERKLNNFTIDYLQQVFIYINDLIAFNYDNLISLNLTLNELEEENLYDFYFLLSEKNRKNYSLYHSFYSWIYKEQKKLNSNELNFHHASFLKEWYFLKSGLDKFTIFNEDQYLKDNHKDKLLSIKNEVKKRLKDYTFPISFEAATMNLEEIETQINKLKEIVNSSSKRKIYLDNRIDHVLKQVGLKPSALNKYASDFSLSDQQRILIARALMTNPEFIVADEPFSTLDLLDQQNLAKLFLELNQELNLTIIWISHNLKLVKNFSKKVVVLYRGKILEIGTTHDIFKNPIHPYTKKLVSSTISISKETNSKEDFANNWSMDYYNNFSNQKLNKISETHFVYGTESEIKKWI